MPRKKRRKKQNLTPEQKLARRIQRKFSRDICTTFTKCGFTHVKSHNAQIEIDGRKGEFDQVFVYKRVIVLLEETCTRDKEAIKDHLNNKVNFHSVVRANATKLVRLLDDTIPNFKAARPRELDPEDCKIIFVYCSRYAFDKLDRAEYAHERFLSHEYLRYFLQLSKTIGSSAKYEMLKFLGLETKDVTIKPGAALAEYPGFVLPELPSGFPKNYKLVTFYVDPATLIELCYALRRDSWQDLDALYQRMIVRSKIRQMRRFIATKGHVYVNNVIVSLPHETSFETEKGKTVSPDDLTEAQVVTVRIPRRFNSVGLIDGQHRVFSYHEGVDEFEAEIAKRREKQQLLVTGIIFPTSLKQDQRLVREAELFLEINDRQSRTKSDLKQSIETIVAPFSDVAIARSVVSEIAKTGPLTGLLKDHFFDEGQIQTTSIVSYALRYLVSLNPSEKGKSLIDHWGRAKAEALRDKDRQTLELRQEYVKWCASNMNLFLSAFRAVIPKDLWTTERKISRALSVTSINGLIFCFRDVVAKKGFMTFDDYHHALSRLDLNYAPSSFGYRSSGYRALGIYIFDKCFSK